MRKKLRLLLPANDDKGVRSRPGGQKGSKRP